MNTTANILNELNEVAPLLSPVSRKMPYSIHHNYFAILTQQITTFVAMHTTSKREVYTLPNGYFDDLPQRMLAVVRHQEDIEEKLAVFTELDTIAPLLNAIDKANVYTTPSQYFKQNSANVKTAKKAAIVSLSNTRKFFNYAAAAMVAGILVTGAFLATNKNQFDYEKYSKIDVYKGLNNVSDEDLVKYLDNTQAVANQQEITTIEATAIPNNITEHLQSFSDEELKQFLKENESLKLKW